MRTDRRLVTGIFALACLMTIPLPARSDPVDWLESWRKENPVWRGVHVMLRSDSKANELIEELAELEAIHVNSLIIEINYHFEFTSHPELRANVTVSREVARRLAAACRQHGIRPIPLFNCLGHQSWSKTTSPLLAKYPKFDETPGQYVNNEGIYCRSWCPQHPDLNDVVEGLLDDLIDAFEADAVHVGMDEVFLIASPHCPRCKGGDPAQLFALAVNNLHAHLVKRRRLEMLIWSDRLLDGKATGLGKWEAATNGTHGAIELIPKDIILCDWHYEPLSAYPGKPLDYVSIPYLLGKGFRVWPSSWRNVDAARALAESAQRHTGEGLLGQLCTTWGAVDVGALAEWAPLQAVIDEWPQTDPDGEAHDEESGRTPDSSDLPPAGEPTASPTAARSFRATTAEQAAAWQRQSRSYLAQALRLEDLLSPQQGGMSTVKIPLDVTFQDRQSMQGYERVDLEINSTATRRIRAVMTRPLTPEPGLSARPAMVCIHGHGGDRNSVYDRQTVYHGFAQVLAEAGYITISTDVGQHQVYESGRTLMGERLWDVMRCVDYLSSCPDVDTARIGCAGLSLGGEMAMWLGAMDDRLKVTVSSGFLTTVANMRQGHCPCWDFPGLTDNFDFSDIYSLTAPRALLCQNGQRERAPGGFPIDIAQGAMDDIRRAYKVFRAEGQVESNTPDAGHEFVVAPAIEFIKDHLQR